MSEDQEKSNLVHLADKEMDNFDELSVMRGGERITFNFIPSFRRADLLEVEAGKFLGQSKPCTGGYIMSNFSEVFNTTRFKKRLFRICLSENKQHGEISDAEIEKYIVDEPMDSTIKCNYFIGHLFLGGTQAKKFMTALKSQSD